MDENPSGETPEIDPPPTQFFKDPRQDFLRSGGHRRSKVKPRLHRIRLHPPDDQFGREVPLQLGDRQKILDPHLMNGEFAREGPGNVLSLEPKDVPRLGAHLKGVDDEKAIDSLQPREEVEAEGAAIEKLHPGGKADVLPELFNHSDAESVIRHHRIAETEDQDAQRTSSGSMNLYPPKMLLKVPFLSLTSMSHEL